MDDVEKVKQKTDIVAIIGEHVALKKAGRNFKGLCPFHSEKTPSFMVSPELQIFKCFGCQESGDSISFLEKHEGMEFYEALKYLADRAGVKLTPRSPQFKSEKDSLYEANLLAAKFYHWLLINHPSGKKALTYLKDERKLASETINTFMLGFAPENKKALSKFLIGDKKLKGEDLVRAGLVGRGADGFYDRFAGRIIFPIFDHRGNAVALAGRVLPGAREDIAKYINSPQTPVYDKSSILYGLNITRRDIKKAKTAVVVEGELDLISPWQVGIRNAVAVKGSALTSGQARILSRLTQKIIFALDSDFAGQEAARRGIEIAEKEGMEVAICALADYKDPDDAARADPEGLKAALKGAIPAWDWVIDSVLAAHDTASGEGKAKISREIVPILAGITDRIVQGHYIGEVASRLDVELEAVASQVESYLATRKINAPVGEAQKESGDKGRRQLLEERLLGLSVSLDPRAILTKETKAYLATPLVKRIVEELEKFLEGAEFEVKRFADSLPAELKQGFSEVILSQGQDSEDEAIRELEVVRGELVELVLKERHDNLKRQIARLEREASAKELDQAVREFDEISRKITDLKL